MTWEQVIAETSAAHGPQGLALHLDLDPEPSEVRRARDFVRVQLAGYDQAELDVIALLLSELLTNAILHGGGRASVDVSVHLHPDAPSGDSPRRGARPSLGVWEADPVTAILVGVSDPSVRQPQPRPPRELPENGLGLQIVGQLSDSWGTVPLGQGGKIVWFLVNARVPSRPDRSTAASSVGSTHPEL